MKKLKEYSDKGWTFFRFKKDNVIINFISKLFLTRCPKCKQKGVRYIGDDLTDNGIWLSVYECKHCETEFI